MSFGTFLIVLFIVCGVIAALQMKAESKRTSKMSPRQLAVHRTSQMKGPLNSQLICPHCQQKGGVHTKSIQAKKGISGGKATGAVLTGGVSLLATGLSRKEQSTEAFCSNCKSTWHF